ncbi:hypothetical protein AWC38_SpisGene7280 [Stylophora pistillata]|uniref:Uncharacterized protein n=1 Tax=Stylophora pistillata TaxID=50429 RepID=A0A2B4SHM3_STYPI|nr:hypothetical protein AWC38_SpisGene7280 [Stylophora pistillata]
MGFSPRHIKPSISTHLPVAKHLLTSKVITDVPEKIKIRKEKQKHYYDRHSHELPKLREGDTIRMRLPNKQWSLGRVSGEEETCSYLVEVNGKHYCRNRKWLRATSEELPESVETNLNMTHPIELVESSPAELPPPMIPSSSQWFLDHAMKATQTSTPNTKQPTMQDKAEKIQETLGKIHEWIDTLIVVHCSTRETRAPDAVQATVTAQLIANTAFTAIVACISSPAEKDQAVDPTLSRIQPFSTDEGHNICGVSKKLPTPEKKKMRR